MSINLNAKAQISPNQRGKIPGLNRDTSAVVKSDTLRPDSAQIKEVKDGKLDAKVDYKSVDSMIIDLRSNHIFLHGDAEVYYQDITLKGDSIVMNMKKNEVFASYTYDSSGSRKGVPYFESEGEHFEAQQMRYNFDTERGLIYEARTQQNDGHITGLKIKKDTGSVIYIQNGEYCPCEDPDAGTYIKARKLKIIQNDKIITGPAYLVVEDIPTPLVLPFGFFPNRNTQASGIVLPRYGFSPGLGFHLLEGGYYWNASPFLDFTFTGDIYSRGSWGLKGVSNYKRRYQYDGQLSLSYSNFIRGFTELGNRSVQQNFFVRWNHRQDVKARPNSSFSADVNAGTGNNFTTNFNSGSRDYLTNTFKSNINYNYRVPNAPINLTFNASHDQNSLDSSVTIRLPEVGVSVSRFFPFKRKQRVGKERWFEKIGFNYTGNFKNQVRTLEKDLFDPSTLDKLKSGYSHNLPISTNFKLFKYFTLSPSFSNKWIWQFQGIEQTWDDELGVVTDTIQQFDHFYEPSISANLNTKIYGMYNFRSKRVQAMRHVLTPSVAFNLRPDYSADRWGYYQSIGIPQEVQDSLRLNDRYTPFQYGLFGVPSAAESGSFRFTLQNNFEMKVKSKKDSAQFKKVKLLDQLTINTDYNIFADSLNWRPLSVTGNATLFNQVNIRFNTTLDPYAFDKDLNRTVNISEYEMTGKLARLTNATFSIGFTLGNKKRLAKIKEKQAASSILYASVPWSLGVNYSFNYTDRGSSPISRSQSINFNGTLQLTNKINIRAQTNYDVINNELVYTTIRIDRDLNCWQLGFNIIPQGGQKSYTFTLNVKPAILKDLKLERKRNWYDLNDF